MLSLKSVGFLGWFAIFRGFFRVQASKKASVCVGFSGTDTSLIYLVLKSAIFFTIFIFLRYVLDDKREADRLISEANAVMVEENPEILEDHDQASIVNNMERNEEEVIPPDEEEIS